MEPCPKCYDPETGLNRGSYMYDENHGTFCDLCCAHDQGWWLLGEHHVRPGHWCCLAGCGHTITPEEYWDLCGSTAEERRRRSRPSALAEPARAVAG